MKSIVALSFFASMLVAPAAGSTPLTVMPLGDSITYGAGSSTTSSYRLELYQRLVRQTGYPIDFVGSLHDGALPDTDHEGHSGWRIDQIAASVNGWLATSQPDVVMLHIGTNDMNQNYQVPTAPDRLKALVEQIFAARPGVKVLLASIVPATDATINARINTFNAAVPGIVAAEQQAGRAIRHVDMTSLKSADLADTLHPNDSGYAKMAVLFHAGLARMLHDRDAPLFFSGFETGETAPSWLDTTAASMNVGGYCCGLTAMEASPRQEFARAGLKALMYSGNDTGATQSYSYTKLFDVHIPIGPDTELSYWVRPQQTMGTFVAIDILFTDGSNLRDSGVVDQWGVRVHPQRQGEGGHLVVNGWTRVRAKLGTLAGKVVDEVRFGYDQPANTGVFRGYLDDVAFTDIVAPYAGENVALGKPATSSAACATTETADRAVNGGWSGGNNDKWCSSAATRSWQVDLGSNFALQRIVIRHAGSGGEPTYYNSRDFVLTTSTDGTNWTTAGSVTGNIDSITSHNITVTARYVRLDVIAATQTGESVARIYEVEVFAGFTLNSHSE